MYIIISSSSSKTNILLKNKLESSSLELLYYPQRPTKTLHFHEFQLWNKFLLIHVVFLHNCNMFSEVILFLFLAFFFLFFPASATSKNSENLIHNRSRFFI